MKHSCAMVGSFLDGPTIGVLLQLPFGGCNFLYEDILGNLPQSAV